MRHTNALTSSCDVFLARFVYTPYYTWNLLNSFIYIGTIQVGWACSNENTIYKLFDSSCVCSHRKQILSNEFLMSLCHFFFVCSYFLRVFCCSQHYLDPVDWILWIITRLYGTTNPHVVCFRVVSRKHVFWPQIKIQTINR